MSSPEAQRLKDLRTRHPMPWKDHIYPNGLIRVLDAEGKEVSLIDLLSYVVASTNLIVKK